jgi:hypothetical protein
MTALVFPVWVVRPDPDGSPHISFAVAITTAGEWVCADGYIVAMTGALSAFIDRSEAIAFGESYRDPGEALESERRTALLEAAGKMEGVGDE